MKKLLLLFFLLAFIKIEAQQNRGIEKSGVRRGFYASFSAGLTSPTGDYKTYSDEVTNADGQVLFGATEKITGKSQFNLDAGYQFGAFGLGLSIGSFSHELSELSFQSDLFDTNFPILQNGGAIDGTYYGTGPDYRLAFGKFSTTASARIGLMDFSTDTFTGSYNGTDTDVPLELIRTEFASDGKTSLGYTSIGLKLSYDISKQLSLFTKTDYFITLSDGLQVTDSGVLLHDINNDKLITAADFDFAGPGLETFINERFTKPKMVNVGFGLTWNFNAPQKGKAVNADGPKKRKSKIKDLDGKENMKMETGIINSGETVDIKGIDDKKTVKLIVPVAINKGLRQGVDNGTLVDTIKRVNGDIKNLHPPFNSHFTSIDEIKDFTWEVIGDKIPNPQYIIEIIKTGSNQQPQRTYIGKTTDSKIAAKKVAKFRAGKALADVVKRTGNPNQGNDDDLDSDGLADTVKTTDGQQQTAGEGFYSWKVTEITTGISSAPSFFTVSDSETTEDCLGYQKNSAMMIVKIDETSLRNTNTVIDNPEDILAKKRHERMGIRALRAKDARHGYRAKQNDARMKDARMKDVRMKDVRMKDARIQNIADKPFEITTEESDKVAPQIDINTKYIRALNHKTIEISKSYLQLIAPILSCKNNILNYNWTVKNKALNIGDSFSGNTVKYDFNVEGVYEINIMPTLNNKNLNAFSIIIICK